MRKDNETEILKKIKEIANDKKINKALEDYINDANTDNNFDILLFEALTPIADLAVDYATPELLIDALIDELRMNGIWKDSDIHDCSIRENKINELLETIKKEHEKAFDDPMYIIKESQMNELLEVIKERLK